MAEQRMWQAKLVDSQRDFVQQIVDQIPEAMGVRNAFEDILDALVRPSVDALVKPSIDEDEIKFRFVVAGAGEVFGTNDEARARDLATDDDLYIIDATENLWLMTDDPASDTDITEVP